MEVWEQFWKRIREVFTDEELNNLIIYEQEQERLRQQEQERQRPEIQLPLDPPQPYQEEEKAIDEENKRGVIVIDI